MGNRAESASALLRNTAAPASQGERDLIAGSEVAGKRGGGARNSGDANGLRGRTDSET